MYSVLFVWCFFTIVTHITSNAQDTYRTTIDLSSYDKLNKTSQVFLNYFNFTSEKCLLNIEVINVPATANNSFFIIQFHSLKTKFNLSNKENEKVNGRDTGLVQLNLQHGDKYSYQLQCDYELKNEVKVLVAVVLYEPDVPVPGGCNLTFNPEVSAYQNVTYNDNMVQVHVQAASINQFPCENNTAQLEMYHLYMRERTLDEDEYFRCVTKMLTPSDVADNAKKVPRPEGVLSGRRYYSAYLGSGTIYGVVAKYNNRVSAYIPVVSYACNIEDWDENCVAPTTVVWKMIIAALLFVGLFTLFVGHAFFTMQMFVVGLVLGFFTGSVISGLAGFFSGWQSVVISIALGGIIGAAWSIFWCRHGVPLISASLSVFFIGYITCCIIYYSDVGDTEFIRRNLNYWGMIVSMVVLFAILLIHTQFSHILACSFLGASAVTISINHYAGGNLHYVFLNNIRRATVTDFNKAVIDPIFQYTDGLLSVMWFALLVAGIIVQFKTNRGRAPFPSRPRYYDSNRGSRFSFSRAFIRRVDVTYNERSPLLS